MKKKDKCYEHLIGSIEEGSIAEELELEAGDTLISINGRPVQDVFDYRYLINDESLTLIIRKADGEEWELDIEKEPEDDLGIRFESGLMDEYKSCCNKCIFCFIDQMPPNMRETLYFKDDDARLSFLQGNYITLTNMSDEDVKRICFYKLSPINISIHTTNSELRCMMLHNRFAGKALERINQFADAGISMNGQIVLCKGINDGEELEKTLADMEQYLPHMQSISVVPVGLTKYREGLFELQLFDQKDSQKVIERVEHWQQYYLLKYGTRLVYCSDEWYIKAQKELPADEEYEGYPQIENGVGMLRSMESEVAQALQTKVQEKEQAHQGLVSIVTGLLAKPYIEAFAHNVEEHFAGLHVNVYGIINNFFGEQITVAGLITGRDIISQLKGKEIGDYLLLPSSMLRSEEQVLLDDVTIAELENTLQTKIRIVQSSGMCFIEGFFDAP